jgi:hypothetical protein
MPINSVPLNPYDKTVFDTRYCPYMEINSSLPNQSYSTLTQSLVVPEKRDMNKDTSVPEPLPNGGLFRGPQSNKPWANIPVIPTDTNLIHYNLKSANPPPGATQQYVSTDRLGNNYAPMIGVYWYNPSESRGMYRMMVTKKEDVKM